MLLTAIIAAVVGNSLVLSFTTQRAQLNRTNALNDAKTILERVSRDIRSANPVLVAKPHELKISVTDSTVGTTRIITYVVATVSGVQQMTSTDVSTDNATGVSTTTTKTLLTGLGLGADPMFTYFDATQPTPVELVASDATSADTDAVRLLTFRVRLDVTGSDVDVDVTQNLSIRNSEA